MAHSNLRMRIITAGVLIGLSGAILAASAFCGWGRWALAALAFVCVGLCSGEFARLCSPSKPVRGIWYLAVTLAPTLILFLFASPYRAPAMAGQAVSLLSAAGGAAAAAVVYWAIATRGSLSEAGLVAQDLFGGLILVALGGAALISSAQVPEAHLLITWLLLVVCSNDIAAYFGGRKFQGPKMAPALSPNKTLSGSLFGILAGTVLGTVFFRLLPITGVETVCLALLVTVAAQAGDLLKSFVKRLHSAKDSGSILPGHGGMLDRLDGVLMGNLVLFSGLLVLS